MEPDELRYLLGLAFRACPQSSDDYPFVRRCGSDFMRGLYHRVTELDIRRLQVIAGVQNEETRGYLVPREAARWLETLGLEPSDVFDLADRKAAGRAPAGHGRFAVIRPPPKEVPR